VNLVRLRLPNVLVRAGENHASVRMTEEPQRRRRFSGGLTAAGTGFRSRYRESAARGGQLVRRLWWVPGWALAAVTLAPALLAVAWLVPGTWLLIAGRLLPLPMTIIFVPLAVALFYFTMRRLPASWPRLGQAGGKTAGQRPDVPAAALLAVVAIAAGFGIWQAVFRSEQVFVAGDPGVYLQYGYWIAQHGTTQIPASPGSFGGAPGLDFATSGFLVTGSSLSPAYLPGLPLVLAAGSWLGGLGGALLMPAVIGGCALLSFGGLVTRLCGAWWAVAAELVLALCLPEIWASRTPFSEPLVQLLLFGGLCLLIDSLTVRRRGFGGFGFGSGDGLALAGLGGLALGLTVLVSIGSLGTVLPAFPVLGLLFAARRPQAAPFGAGLLVGIGTGLAAGLVLARPYLSTVAPQLRLIGLCAAGFGVATALIAPLAVPSVRTWVRRVCAVELQFKWFGGEQLILPSLGGVLTGLAVAVPVVALAGFALRPYLQTVRGQTDPAVIRQVALLQRLEHLPVDGLRQYYESSLTWVFWYLGVPTVLLACAGAVVIGRRAVLAALRVRPEQSAADAPPRSSPGSATGELPAISAEELEGEALALWALPFLIIGWSVATVLWDPSVVPWQPLASHRLVPVVLPGLLLLAVWIASRLTSRASVLGASRTAVVLVATCCVLALAIPPLVTTLNPTLAAKARVGNSSSGISKLISRVKLRGVGASATYSGSLAAAAALCAAIGQSASVLFVNQQSAQSYAPVVRDLCGQPTASLVATASSPAELKEAVSAIERTGRRPVLLGLSAASVSASGITPRQVVALQTSGDAEELTGPPGGNWPVSYSLWLATPAGG